MRTGRLAGLGCVVFLIAVSAASANLDDGLVAHYPMDGSGADASGNGHDGVVIGAVDVPDRHGNPTSAYYFDGAGSYIQVDSAIGDVYTYSLWFKPSETVSSAGVGGGLFGRAVAPDVAAPYCSIGALTHQVADELITLLMHYQPNNDSMFYWTGSDVGQNIDASWNHIAFVWESAELNYRLYLNGQDMETARIHNFPDILSLNQMTIGAYGTTGTFFDGAIDEVRIYDRALSPDEIADLYCLDLDDDGYCEVDDCSDDDASINPGALELPGNFADENCDGSLGECDPCFTWRNHGEYIRCVASTIADLVDAGYLSEAEGDALVSSAARSDIGKRNYVAPECQP